MKIQSLCKWLLPAAAGVTLLASVGYAAYPAAAPYVSSPAPLNQARIWFYREANPYDGIGLPYLRLNGTVVGVSQPGAAFFVDVPPGHYHLSADSYGEDFNQTRDIDIGPGQVAFAKVQSNENWIYGGGGGGRGGGGGYKRDTYYVWTVPPQTALPVISQSYLFGNTPQYSGSPGSR
jgi:hypothetical protein